MSSVAKEVSAHTLSNQVVLERRTLQRTAVLVEGGTDSRYIRQFIDRDLASLTVCHDRERVLLTLTYLRQRGVTGTLGIVDRDYNNFIAETEQVNDPDVVMTDLNDLDATLFPSALGPVLNEFANIERVVAAEAVNQMTALEIVVREAAKIGALRMISKRDGLNLKFRGMTYQFESNTSFEICIDKTIGHILSRSQTTISEQDTKQKVSDFLNAFEDKLAICQGHDIVRLLGRSLRRLWGSNSDYDINSPVDNELHKLIRLGSEKEYFRQCEMFTRLKAWELENPPWRIFS